MAKDVLYAVKGIVRDPNWGHRGEWGGDMREKSDAALVPSFPGPPTRLTPPYLFLSFWNPLRAIEVAAQPYKPPAR